MPKFSKKSKKKLKTCAANLQKLFNVVVKHVDCTVLEGHRGKEAQNHAFDTGRSQLKWDKGNHNKSPSKAVDVVPYPIDWDNVARFREFAQFVKGVAAGLDIKITSGGLDWKKFKDYPHFEEK